MVRLIELLGTFGITAKDVGEITGFFMSMITISVFIANILTEFLIGIYVFSVEMLGLPFSWISKYIKGNRHKKNDLEE